MLPSPHLCHPGACWWDPAPCVTHQAWAAGSDPPSPAPSPTVAPVSLASSYIPTLALMCFPVQNQARAFPESLRKRSTATCQPWHRIALHHGHGHPRHGAAKAAACWLSHGTVPSLARMLRMPGQGLWHSQAQVACAGRLQPLSGQGCFQESAVSPVPGWFYTLQGQDNARKLPERGTRPGPGTKGPETWNQPRLEPRLAATLVSTHSPTVPNPAATSKEELLGGFSTMGMDGQDPLPWWYEWSGGVCASLALSKQGHPNGLGNGGKCLRGKGTPHGRGQAGKGGTGPVLMGSVDEQH